MTYLLRTRLRPAILATWAVSLLFILVFAEVITPLPNLGGGTVLISLFMASGVASSLVSVSSAPLSPMESMSAKHVPLRLFAVGVGWLLVTCAVLLCLGTVTGSMTTSATLRTLVAYCGIGYLAVAAVGELGVAAPVLAAVLLGATVTAESSALVRWAVSTRTDPASSLVCAVLFLGGLAVAWSAARRSIP